MGQVVMKRRKFTMTFPETLFFIAGKEEIAIIRLSENEFEIVIGEEARRLAWEEIKAQFGG